MELTQAAEIFSALSQESRLKVLRDLVTAGPSGRASGDIAGRLAIPASTLSCHLSALERAGLVRSVRQSRKIVHSVRFSMLRDLIGFLTETCCNGQPELCVDLARILAEFPADTEPMEASFNVLFLCTKNSARSIMAEAVLTEVGAARFHAYSAGSHPGARPMPEVLEKLQAFGHHISNLRSKSWKEFTRPNSPRMDFVIALCDTLDGQICPDFGDTVVTAAWPLPDPAKFSGSQTQRSLLLNELYGSLRRRMEIFVSLPLAQLDRHAVQERVDAIACGGLPVTMEHRV